MGAEETKENSKRLISLNDTLEEAIGKVHSVSLKNVALYGTLSKVLGKAVHGVFELNKVGGDLGLSVSKQMDHYDGVVGSLEDTTDQITALGLAMNAQRAGLDGNNLGMMKLANQQRLLTGSSEKVFSTMAALKEATGMSRERISKLSTDLIKTSNMYNVSADKLLSGLAKLAEQLVDIEAMGLGPQVVDAVTKLSGQFPLQEKGFHMAVKAIADGSSEAIGLAARIGAMEEKNAFANAKTSEQTQAALLGFINKYSKISGSRIDQFSGGVGGVLRATNIVKGIYGDNATAMMNLQQALSEGSNTTISEGDRAAQARQTLSAALGRLWNVILIGLMPVVKFLIPIVEGLSTLLSGIIGIFSGFWILKLLGVQDETNQKLDKIAGINKAQLDATKEPLDPIKSGAYQAQVQLIGAAFQAHFRGTTPDPSLGRLIDINIEAFELQKKHYATSRTIASRI